MQDAVHLAEEHRGLGDGEFIALAAHGFNQDGKVQFAPAIHAERVGGLGVLHAQGNVRLHFLEQARAQVARGDKLPLRTREGRIVHTEIHGNRRLVNLHKSQRLGIGRVANRVANGQLVETANGHDIADLGAFAGHAL